MPWRIRQGILSRDSPGLHSPQSRQHRVLEPVNHVGFYPTGLSELLPTLVSLVPKILVHRRQHDFIEIDRVDNVNYGPKGARLYLPLYMVSRKTEVQPARTDIRFGTNPHNVVACQPCSPIIGDKRRERDTFFGPSTRTEHESSSTQLIRLEVEGTGGDVLKVDRLHLQQVSPRHDRTPVTLVDVVALVAVRHRSLGDFLYPLPTQRQ